ncbi:MAG: Tetratricopeptide repeat protein [Lacunisphaera sp.]|nr:Tetratricopeptide repeat protein [Lacunisphaera sp.]
MKPSFGLICLVVALGGRAGAEGVPPARPPELRAIDFWLGDWEVFLASGPKDGDNRIEKLLGGFAVLENWTELDGHEGKSWFYYHSIEKHWKQVWVTDDRGVKEKTQVTDAPPGGVRFRGEIFRKDGRRILDQTTLAPLPDGRVRQVIEQSTDDGKTWQTVYDAIYVRRLKKS